MIKSHLKSSIIKSFSRQRLVFLYRLFLISRNIVKISSTSFKWLFLSREYSNFTYDLSPTNKNQLSWFVANACNVPISEILGYLSEIQPGSNFHTEIQNRLCLQNQRARISTQAFWGRRSSWYAIIRATKPMLVVESGTENGFGSVIISEALRQNGSGQLVTIDIDKFSGCLIGQKELKNTYQIIDSSICALESLKQIDLFIHDSDHSSDYESLEYKMLENRLSDNGIVISDNSHVSSVLADWALKNNRKFLYFHEMPIEHWYKGAGVGISIPTI